MARTLSLKLQEDVYETLLGIARKAGRSLEALASERLTSLARRRTAGDVFEEIGPREGESAAELTELRPEARHASGDIPRSSLEADPLMEMAGVDDFEPVSVDEVVYR